VEMFACNKTPCLPKKRGLARIVGAADLTYTSSVRIINKQERIFGEALFEYAHSLLRPAELKE
jgi:hypothetical protein